MSQVVHWRQAMVRDFVDIKGKLRLHMGVLPFRKIDHRTVLRFQLGKLDRDRPVCCLGMTDVVPDVMRQGTDGKREFVGILGFPKQEDNEIARAHVMGKVREKP